MKFLKFLKERFICLTGVHGYANIEDVEKRKCSFCGKDFKGHL